MATAALPNSIITDHYSLEVIDPRECAEEWESFVESCDNRWLCHTIAWLDVLTHVWSKLRPCYLVVREKGNNAIKAGLPLCLIKSSLRKKCLISPPLSTLIEPLGNDQSALFHLFNKLPDFLSQNRISSLEFKTFYKTESVPENTFKRFDNHCIHTIDLTQNKEALMKSFNRSNVRNRIKKALKGPLSCKFATDLEELHEFYKLYAITRKRVGLPSIPLRYFEAIWHNFKKDNQVELLLAYHDTSLAAGVFTLKYHQRTSAEALGYNVDYIGMCPNHLLFWTTIENAKDEGKLEADFGRTPLNNKGLVTFKGRWGGEKTMLPSFSYPDLCVRDNQEANAKMNLIKGSVKSIPFTLYLNFSDLFYTKLRYQF